MVECPWCLSQVIIINQICPECRQEVLPEHLEYSIEDEQFEPNDVLADKQENDREVQIADSFQCAKCGHEECEINEGAMTGAGLSNILDINYQHYVFISCAKCGFVEIYNPNIWKERTY